MAALSRIRRVWAELRQTAGEMLGRAATRVAQHWAMFSTYGEPSAEKVKTSYEQYAERAYGGNGAVFGVLNVQVKLFSEVRFALRDIRTKKLDPAAPALDKLRQPWPNGTTGDMLARMRQDAQLAGNAYVRNAGDRLERLRPDWVTIVSWVRDGQSPGQETADGRPIREVIGYLYEPLGDPERVTEFFPEDEVAHWAPIPDPLANWRGMSVLTPVLKEINADLAMTEHRDKFFRNSATPNMIIKYAQKMERDQRERLRDSVQARHGGPDKAGGTLVLDEGADPMIVGSKFSDAQFDELQAAGENRIAVAAGVPALVAGLKIGLDDAAWSMYRQALRAFADLGVRPDWRSSCSALSKLVDIPEGQELWYDTSDVVALQEGEQEAAGTMSTNAGTAQTLIMAGFEPPSVVAALTAGDFGLLVHSGLVSVQMHDPTAPPPESAPAAGDDVDEDPAAGDDVDQADEDDDEDQAPGAEARRAAWFDLLDLLRSWDPDMHPRDGRGRFRRVGASDLTSGAVPVGSLSTPRLQTLLADIAADPAADAADPVFYLIGDELNARDATEAYRRLVDSVPDAEGLAELDEVEVMDLFSEVTAVSRDPDPDAFGRLVADLDRRTAEVAAERERPARELLARPVADLDDEELQHAYTYASELGDVPAQERVMVEWDRREQVEREQIAADQRAAVEAEAARLAAERAEAEAAAAAAAARAAEVDRWRQQYRLISDESLREVVTNLTLGRSGDVDPDEAEVIRDEARRRQKEREAGRTTAERRRRWVDVPAVQLSDEDLRDALADHENDGWNTNRTRAIRREALREETARRQADAERRAALAVDVPTGPLWLPNPTAKVAYIESAAGAYRQGHTAAGRLALARRRALGVPDDTTDKDLTAAQKADPRSRVELAGMTLAWYRHLVRLDGDEGQPEPWNNGFSGESAGPAPRPTLPPARIQKPAAAWKEIEQQAIADRQAGDESTARRFLTAINRAYGLPDDVDDEERRTAVRWDDRTDNQRAAAYIAEFRGLAEEQGADPDDPLRSGPPDRGTPTAKARPSHHRESTPDEQARIDALVGRGLEYVDAYAEVHGVDADRLRREQAGQAAAGGKATGGTVKALRKAYDEHVTLQYLEAEQWTRGHLLSKRGQAKRIDPADLPALLFSGPLRNARPYASEELLRFWAEHPRMTFAEFRENVTGRARQARQRATAAAGGQGRDFV